MLVGGARDKLLRSARASKLSYVNIEKKLAHSTVMQINGCNKVCFDRRKRNELWCIDSQATNARVYAWKHGPSSMIVSFRGSSSIKDILTFLDSRYVPFSFCDKVFRIHAGVHTMFESIENVLTDEMMVKREHIHSVTFCGHSLGGSLALLAAAYYGHVFNKTIRVSCHTFGSPKIGDEDFYSWLADGTDEVINVVNNGDIVPSLPPFYSASHHKMTTTGDVLLVNPIEQHDLNTYIKQLECFH